MLPKLHSSDKIKVHAMISTGFRVANLTDLPVFHAICTTAIIFQFWGMLQMLQRNTAFGCKVAKKLCGAKSGKISVFRSIQGLRQSRSMHSELTFGIHALLLYNGLGFCVHGRLRECFRDT